MEQEIARLIERLHGLEPGSDEYTRVLSDLWSIVQVRNELRERPLPEGILPKPELLEMMPDPKPKDTASLKDDGTWTPGGGSVDDSESVPKQENGKPSLEEIVPIESSREQSSEQSAGDQPKLEATFVRGELAKARRRGVNVTEIVASFGVDNFKEIPADRYAEILEKLKEAG